MNVRGWLRLLTFGSVVALGCGGSSGGDNSTTPTEGGTESADGGPTPEGGTSADGAAEASACAAGKVSCAGACVDPLTDDGNCGGCGLSCPGGCSMGECTVTLATGSIVDFDVAGATVYFIDGQPGVSAAIEAVPVTGGTATTIVSSRPYDFSEITADASNVYFTYQDSSQSGYVAKATIAGGTITTIATMQQAPSTIEVDATTVYWVDGYGNLGMSPIATPAPQLLMPMMAQAGTGLALGNTDVYWASANDGLVSAPLGGGQISTIFTGLVFGVAADASNVYLANNATDNGFGTGTNAILKAPVGGGVATTLVAAKGPMALAADGTSVYWTDFSGTLMKVAAKGGVVSTLVAAGVAHLGGEYGTHALAVDATSVYVATGSADNGQTGAAIIKVTPK
jgi:hypothetical protein